MKKSIVSICLFLCCLAYGQEQDPPKKYDLKIEDITSKPEAKMVTDILRAYINPADNPFAYFPTFQDDKDSFVFHSDREINEEEIKIYLKDKYDLNLIYCKKIK
ncbi:MAG: hypothetical protein ACO1O6_09900 [Bacteroidota bacterium]